MAIFVYVKRLAILLLFLFVAFLSTPSIVKLIEKKADVSQFYNFSEEEDDVFCFSVFSLEMKENNVPQCQLTSEEKTILLLNENQQRHDNVADEIFLPPPEMV